MSSLAPINSIDIQTGPTVTNNSSSVSSSSLFNIDISIDGAAFQPALTNLQNNAVQTSVDTYLGSLVALNTAKEITLKITAADVATGTGVGAQFGFLVDLTQGLTTTDPNTGLPVETPAQAIVSAGINLGLNTLIGTGTGLGANALALLAISAGVGTAPVWVPTTLGILAATAIGVGINLGGAYITQDKDFNVGDYLWKLFTKNGVKPESITKPTANQETTIHANPDGSLAALVIERDSLGNPLRMLQSDYTPDGVRKDTVIDFNNTGVQATTNVSGSIVSTNVFGNNAGAPSGVTVGPNQTYIDTNKYDYGSGSWADVAKTLGVTEAELRAANPGSENIPSPANTVINLTTIDNGPAPVPTVTPNPTATQQHINETSSETNTSSGYSENSPTVSVKFNNNKLNKTDLASLVETSMGTGGTRPGAVMADPYAANQSLLDLSNYGFGQNSTVAQRLNDASYFGRMSSPFTSGYYTDPLLLDLSGNGIGSTSYKNNAVLFDMDHSGTLKRTSWVDDQTGILVKPDANGNVTSISQTFSEYYGGTVGTGGNAGSTPFVNGFDALASEDTNHDGKITSSDTIWSQLKVWVDSNHDATVNAGELKTLSSLGITQFDTGNFLGHETNNGNPVTANSTFVMGGNTRTMSDINLISEGSSHTFTTQGTGTVDTTVTKDSQGVVKTVKMYQENSTANSTLNAATLNVDNVDGGVGNDTLIAKSTGSWLIGGGGSNTYQGGVGNDVFVISALDDPANVHGGGGEDMVMVGSATGMTINMAQMDVTIAEGSAGNDVIMSGGRSAVYIKGGSDGNDLLIGGAGDDVITGGDGYNTIIGGTGKAIIYAGPNGDLIYGAKGDSIINAGKGNDTIIGGIGNDVIKVGMGNANIDGGGGTNIVQLHGSYGDYKITQVSNGYWISDKVTNRDGTVFVTNVQKLNFSDIQAIDLNSVFAMPVKDTLTTNSTGGTLNRNQIHLISAAQLLANDQALSSTGPLRISSVSKAVGGTVQLTAAGDVQFTPDSAYTGIMSFRYTVVDAQGHSAINVVDSATGQNAIMNAKVTLATPDVPTDPQAAQEWYLSDSNILPVWQDYTGKGVRIGQFEPGGAFSVEPEILNYNHPDLASNVDIPWLTTQEVAGTLPTAYSNHATMVAGIMVAALNGTGSVGVAYDAKIAGEYYDGNLTSLSTLAQYDVANNSWSATPNFAVGNFDPGTSQSTGDFLLANAKYAAFNGRGGKGTVIVESAGNGRQNQETAQGSIVNNNRFSLQVGGINAPGDLSTLDPVNTPFSNPGASLLVSAPASNIVSTSQLVITSQGSIYGSDSSVMDGTSFATPIVSGIVALMLEANPNLGYRDVQEILAMSARKVNDSNTSWTTNTGTHWNGGGLHTSQDYGFGNVDALAAVRLAETWLGQKTGSNESVVSASSSTVKNAMAGNSVSSTVTMASGIQVEHAEVDVDLTYGHMKDVTLTLIAPNGTTQSVLLSNNNPNDTSTALKYTFMSTHDWGEKSAGTWTLQVTDSATGSPITLNSWGLRLYGSQTTGDDTYIYTNEYASQVAQNSARANLNDAVNGTSGGINTINAAAMSGNSAINLLTGTANLGSTTLTITNPTNFNNIFTGDGNDTLVANNNKGILDGGRGTNTLTGGTGKNIFVVHQRANGQDTINSFTVSQGDRLDLVGFGGLNYSQLTKTQQGSDVLIGGLGNGQSILVKSITVAALTSSQIAFQDTFIAPDGFTISGSSNDNLVTGVGTVNLVGGFNNAATADTSNGKLSYTLSGTVYRHDLATADNFVIANPTTWPNFNNALQGFKPGIDKIDLSVVGIPDASYLFLKPKDYVVLNTSPLVHGVEVTIWDGTQDVPLVYLDSIEATQLKASDFIFANGLPGPDAPIAAETPVAPNHRVPLDTDGTENPFLVGSNNGVTISPDGTTVTSSVDYVLPNTINKLVLTGTADLVGTANDNGDTITSNTGQDTLIGGTGNDTYIINNSDDVIVENPGSGTDSVQTSVSYALNDNVENLTLTGTSDINGTSNALNNVITGNIGANVLDGSTGNDTMIGGLGNDMYVVDSASDLITENSNEGIDTVQSSITYTLTNANLENLTLTGTAALNGTGNNGNNFLIGNSAANSLSGGSGNDTLAGNGGNDTLDGGLGNDAYQFLPNYGTDTILDAGGTDTLDFSLFTTNVSVSLGSNVISGDPGNSISWTNSPEVMENLTTGSGNDTLNGSSLANVLIGNDGNDILIGLAGNDTMNGSAGDDSYLFADGFGADSITDASGTDTLDFSLMNSAITYNALTGTVTNGSNSVSFTPDTTTFEQIIGGNKNDSFTGGAFTETFVGGAGNDTFNGGSGNDVYMYANSWGSDSITAGSGIETVDLSAVTTNLNISMTSGSGNEVSDGTNLINWTSIIENITTGSGIDTINGTSGNNYINSGAGSDAIWAALGNDTIDSGAGNDRYVYTGIWGNDSIIDSSGTDQLDFSTDASNVIFNLSAGAGNEVTDGTSTINWSGDIIENVKAGTGNDSITGNGGANSLSGGAGNDTLNGGLGNDTLDGGLGDDVYQFLNGFTADSVTDAGGNDTFDFSQITSAISYNAATGSVTTDSSSLSIGTGTIENVLGGSGADSLSGSADSDSFTGGTGNDTLDGGAGNDTYFYTNGWGSDSIMDVSGIDTVNLSAVTTALNINMAASSGNEISDGTNLINWSDVIEKLITGSGNDTVNGTSGDNVITLGAGSDAIWAALGNDTIDGGDGNDRYVYTGTWGNDSIIDSTGTDTLDFHNSSLNVTFNLTAGTGNEVSDGTSTINWDGAIIENILGGSGNESMTGNSLNNSLIAGAGNDTLNGGAGNDTLDGGAGNDLYQFQLGYGSESIMDASGTDTLDFSLISSAITYSVVSGAATMGADSVNFNPANTVIEGIIGGSGADSFTGGSASESFTGGAGNDTLDGGSGNDIYRFANGWGVDSLSDASGTDTVDMSAVTTSLNIDMGTSGTKVISGANMVNWNGTIIENMMTGSGSDIVNGTSGGNLIVLNDGNDSVWAAGGNDTIDGGDGNDRYVYTGTWGNDSIIDSTGTDTLDFHNSSLNVTFNLTAGTGNEVSDGTSTINWDGAIIENILGGSGNEGMTGNNLANTFIGGHGNDTLMDGAGNDSYLFAKGDGVDQINDFDTTAGNLDKIAFDSTVSLSAIAVFQTGNGDLQIGYTDSVGDLITVQHQFAGGNTIERFELSNGQFMTDADMNQVIADMAAYAASHSITISSLSDVENNNNLMALVNAGWHS